jgi:hypothetical protein
MSQRTAEVVTRPTPQRPPGVGSGGCDLIFGLGWTGFSLIFVIVPIAVFVAEWQTSNLLRTSGVTTEAVVISRRIDEDSEGDTYYVTYRYRVPIKGDQMQLTHEESVDHDTYQELSPESRVLVRYSATNPEVVRLEGRSRTFEAILLTCFMLFGGLFVLIGVWFVYSSWRKVNRASLLARRGELTTGRVTDCWIETDSDGDKEYCVAFRFVEPGQSEITTAEYNRKAYSTLQVGDSVQVRYVPGKTDICCLKM